jgi:hypothetical protein
MAIVILFTWRVVRAYLPKMRIESRAQSSKASAESFSGNRWMMGWAGRSIAAAGWP